MRARLALLLALVASGTSAQVFRVPPVRTVATLGVATTVKIVAVTDGLTAADCATGGGSAVALCLATGSAWIAIPTSASSGTVSSIGIAVPSEWSVSGSPVTTSGTITITEATQTANTVYAGPTTGSAAAPGFRSLVSADIPNNAANTSGLAGTATALAANGANCSAGSYPLGVDASGAAEGCTVVAADPTLVGDVDGLSSANDLDEAAVEAELEAVLDLQDLQGAVTDAQVPNTVTISLAAAATALAANGANCSAGSYPLGVDASGAAESCTAAGVGDVVGPASATDNAITRYDSTTGKLLQNSAIFATDAGVLAIGGESSSFTGIKNGTDKSGSLAVRAVRADNGLTVSLVGYSLMLGGPDPSANNDHLLFFDAPRSEWTFGSGVLFGWGPNAANPFADADVNITRHSAANLALSTARTTDALGTIRLGEVLLTPQASAPTCNAGAEGLLYSDTSHALCFCDGTTWLVAIGAGTCA